jgi:hypothetical protein
MNRKGVILYIFITIAEIELKKRRNGIDVFTISVCLGISCKFCLDQNGKIFLTRSNVNKNL